MRNMADFEASNPEAALAYLLGRLVEFPAPVKSADISTFLELESTILEGLFCIQGPYEKLREFMHLMKVSGTERTIAFAGWMMACHFTAIFEPIQAQVIFFRKPMVASTSMNFLRDLLKSALIYLGMPKAQDDVPDAIRTKVKLFGTTLFHGKLDRNFPMQQFIDVWDQASTICDDASDIRLVSHVGAVNPDMPLRYYGRCGQDETTVAQISYMKPTHGGGPTDATPVNAQDYQVRQRNNLASFLISQGVDVASCVPFIDSLLKGSGPEAVSTILSVKFPGKKWDGLLRLASALNIPMPEVIDKVERAKRRVQQKFKNHAREFFENMPVEALILQPGCIKNEDETDSQQMQKITPNASGVVLLRYDVARPWVEKGTPISQDELSVVIVGTCLHPNKCECNSVQLPVKLNDEPLVVSGCMHHLGVKRANYTGTDQEEIPVAESQVVALTAFQDEIHESEWGILLKSPVKTMMRLLLGDSESVELLAPPWGRSFQRAGKKVQPNMATSVQCHVRICKGELRRFMKASGAAGVYTIPKTEDHKVLNDYQVIWLNESAVDFAVSLSKVDNHYGIVRGSRSDGKSKGIRFDKADYMTAFANLKPDEKPPLLVMANHHFKIAPTPLGTTGAQVQEWLQLQGWDAKPIRALTGTCWLCVAEKKFEDVFTQWNGSPILIKWIDAKKTSPPTVLAGQIQKISLAQMKTDVSTSATSSTSGDGDIDDPWKAYISQKGQSATAKQSRQNLKMQSIPILAQQPRRVEAPIEDRFQRHDAALQDLKAQTDKEISQLRENLSKVEKAVENQSLQMQMNMEQTNGEFKALRAETTSQFQAMTNAFAESLKSAITQHDSQMSVQFVELKQLIANRSSNQSPPQKKSKNGQHDSDLWLFLRKLREPANGDLKHSADSGILPLDSIRPFAGCTPVAPALQVFSDAIFEVMCLPSFFRLDSHSFMSADWMTCFMACCYASVHFETVHVASQHVLFLSSWPSKESRTWWWTACHFSGMQSNRCAWKS